MAEHREWTFVSWVPGKELTALQLLAVLWLCSLSQLPAMWQSALLVFSANRHAFLFCFLTQSERDAKCISKLLVAWCTGHSGVFFFLLFHTAYVLLWTKAEWNCNTCTNENLPLQIHHRTRTEHWLGFSPEDIRYRRLRNDWLDLCQAAHRHCSFEVKNSVHQSAIKC